MAYSGVISIISIIWVLELQLEGDVTVATVDLDCYYCTCNESNHYMYLYSYNVMYNRILKLLLNYYYITVLLLHYDL